MSSVIIPAPGHRRPARRVRNARRERQAAANRSTAGETAARQGHGRDEQPGHVVSSRRGTARHLTTLPKAAVTGKRSPAARRGDIRRVTAGPGRTRPAFRMRAQADRVTARAILWPASWPWRHRQAARPEAGTDRHPPPAPVQRRPDGRLLCQPRTRKAFDGIRNIPGRQPGRLSGPGPYPPLGYVP